MKAGGGGEGEREGGGREGEMSGRVAERKVSYRVLLEATVQQPADDFRGQRGSWVAVARTQKKTTLQALVWLEVAVRCLPTAKPVIPLGFLSYVEIFL